MRITVGSGRPDPLEFEWLEQRVLLSAVSFIAAQPFAAGSNPTSVMLADLNGDGQPDMAVANNSSDTVSVLMNTTPAGATTPSFSAKQDFSTGAGPCSVWVADINGDGKPDLIVANYLSGTVSVLLNTTIAGSITPSFSARQDFTTGRGPNSVTVADLNGDGKPDIITANYQDPGTVSVLMNTTTPGAAKASFAAHQDFLTGDGAWAVSAADINNDGRPDLVVADYDSQTVSVLLNTTAPGAAGASFAAHQDFPVGRDVTSVAVADLNGDGKGDLVATNGGPGTVSVLLNTTAPGAATASFAAEQEFTTGSDPQSVSVADINGDGTPDLAVANTGDGTVSVLLNTTAPGAATFTFAARQDFTTGAGPFFVSVADLNGDGKGDLAVANSNDGTVSVLLNATGNAVGALPAAFVTTPTGAQKGNVSLSYSLLDPESAACSIQAQYSIDGGATWHAATAGPGGDGVSGLASSPAGTPHTFVWNSGANLGTATVYSSVQLKITPIATAGAGTAGTTGNFTVNYRDLSGVLGTTWTLPAATIAGKSLAGSVSVVVSNLGNVALPAGQTVTITFVARDTTNSSNPDVTLLTLSNQSVSALAAGGTKTFAGTVSRATGLPADSYQVLAKIVPVQSLTESNTANNLATVTAAGAAKTIAVASAFFDLAGVLGTTWTLPSSVIAGKSFSGKVSVVVSNLGNVALPTGQQVNIQFLARDLTNPTNPDITLATLSGQSVSALAANGSKTFSTTLSRPTGLPADSYQILANIVPVQSLAESNLADNLVMLGANGLSRTLLSS